MNAKTTIKLISAVLTLSAGAATAADWQPAGVAGERLAVYVDGGSIQQATGGMTRITSLEDFGKVQYLSGGDNAHRSREATLLVDCGTRQVGFESWQLFEGAQGQGKAVWRWNSEGRVAMFTPIAGSSQERVLERACGGPVMAQR
jgi:hypothetical protein